MEGMVRTVPPRQNDDGVRTALHCERLEDRCNPAGELFVTTDRDVVNAADTVNSLREAVNWANANPPPAGGKHLIEFSIAVKGKPVTLQGGLNYGRIALRNDIYIKGGGAADYIIQRDPQSAQEYGLFSVSRDKSVTIEGLTLRNGKAPSSEGGGAIVSLGTLGVINCVVRDNVAVYGKYGTSSGGAIYGLDGSVSITGSTLTKNGASYGGAIRVADTPLTVTDSTISENTGGYAGGGVYSSGSKATFDNVLASKNSAVDNGAGIRTSNTDLTLKGGSKLSDNQTAGKGGGVYVGGGSITYDGVTIGDNLASVGDGVFLAGAQKFVIGGVTWVNDKESS